MQNAVASRRAIAVDSGPLYALFNAAERTHKAATRFVADGQRALVINWPVLTEVVYLLRNLPDGQRAFLEWAAVATVIDDQTTGDVARVVEIMAKYRDLPADLADASIVALCERLNIDEIATLDSDFEVYRTKDRKRLRNVFPPT